MLNWFSPRPRWFDWNLFCFQCLFEQFKEGLFLFQHNCAPVHMMSLVLKNELPSQGPDLNQDKMSEKMFKSVLWSVKLILVVE